MTNNAQLLPLPELSDDDLELLHYNPNTSDVVEFLNRYAQSYALACIEAAKPAETCNYPDCKCPFDAPADPNWCARGLPKQVAKPADHIRDATKMVDALGSLPVEPHTVAWLIKYEGGKTVHLHNAVADYRHLGGTVCSIELIEKGHAKYYYGAEIAKRDAEIVSLKYQLGGGELAAQELERQVDYLRAKLAGVDGLVEAMKEVLRISDRQHDAWDKAKQLIATYEAVQGTK